MAVRHIPVPAAAGKKSIQYEEGASVHRRERVSGEFDRTLTVPVEIDPDGIKAQYRDGVLALFIPIAEKAKPRSIRSHKTQEQEHTPKAEFSKSMGKSTSPNTKVCNPSTRSTTSVTMREAFVCQQDRPDQNRSADERWCPLACSS